MFTFIPDNICKYFPNSPEVAEFVDPETNCANCKKPMLQAVALGCGCQICRGCVDALYPDSEAIVSEILATGTYGCEALRQARNLSYSSVVKCYKCGQTIKSLESNCEIDDFMSRQIYHCCYFDSGCKYSG